MKNIFGGDYNQVGNESQSRHVASIWVGEGIVQPIRIRCKTYEIKTDWNEQYNSKTEIDVVDQLTNKDVILPPCFYLPGDLGVQNYPQLLAETIEHDRSMGNYYEKQDVDAPCDIWTNFVQEYWNSRK